MTDFPTLLYKCPGPWSGDGYTYGTRPAADDAEMQAALAAGYRLTLPEAVEAFRNPAPVSVSPLSGPAPDVPADDAPVTRAELEQKAAELGIRFDGRTGDKTLMKRIEEALAAQEVPVDVVDQA